MQTIFERRREHIAAKMVIGFLIWNLLRTLKLVFGVSGTPNTCEITNRPYTLNYLSQAS